MLSDEHVSRVDGQKEIGIKQIKFEETVRLIDFFFILEAWNLAGVYGIVIP